MKLHESLQQWGNSYLTAQETEKVGIIIRILEVEKTVTLPVAVSPETRSFNQLVKTDKVERSSLLASISTYFMIMINELFSREKSITHTQIVLFVDEFLNIQHLTVEDAVMFMRGIKTGKYATNKNNGKVYGKIDIPTLNEWLDIYLEERDDEFEKARKQERNNQLGNSARVSSVPGLVNYDKHVSELFGNHVKREKIK